MNTLQIGDRVYPLGEVFLYLDVKCGGEGLEFSLYAEGEELGQAGLAINCMTIPGERRIARTVFQLEEDSRDTVNELAESVIMEPGGPMELDFLRITFGNPRDGWVDATLEAQCHRTGEDGQIPVRGRLSAKIVRRQDQTDGGPQLHLPL